MKSHETTITWQNEDLRFDADVMGFPLVLDSEKAHGGKDMGPPPKPLLLTALAGCTGMDVIAILKKMEALPEDFSVDVSGRLRDAHPRIYKEITVTFRVKGDVPAEKLEKAVALSRDRFCGVSAMLKETAEIKYVIELENQKD